MPEGLRGTTNQHVNGGHRLEAQLETVPLSLSWVRPGRAHASGAVEGPNGKAKLPLRKAFVFESSGTYELALCHGLGSHPEHDPAD